MKQIKPTFLKGESPTLSCLEQRIKEILTFSLLAAFITSEYLIIISLKANSRGDYYRDITTISPDRE